MNTATSITAKYESVDAYMEDFMQTLENFCQKSPAQPKIEWLRGGTKIYLYPKFDPENPIIMEVDTMKDKKEQIKHIKDILEKTYPIVFSKKIQQYSPEEIEEMTKRGMSIREALEKRKTVFLPRYKILRVHHRYQEMDVFDLYTKSLIKFKLYMPLITFLDLLYDNSLSDLEHKEKVNEAFYKNKKFLFAIKKGQRDFTN